MSGHTDTATSGTGLFSRLLNWADRPQEDNAYITAKLHTVIRILIITVKEFNKNELTIRSSALTYTILLSLVPMLAMSTAIVKGMGGGDQLRTVVYSYIDTLDQTNPMHQLDQSAAETTAVTEKDNSALPAGKEGASITNHLRSAANQLFDYVDRTDFATLGTIGVLGILLSAILVLGNIELSMNTIWHVSSGRSLMRKVTDYLTFMILMPLSINFGFAANTILKNDRLLNKMMSVLPAVWVQTSLLFLVPLFFISLTLFLIYIFFPHTKVQPVSAFIGAIFAGSLWFATQNIYIGLQVGVSKYNAIYGSFATLPLFLVWMFLGWVFILAGAQLAFACQRHRNYQLLKVTHSPLQQLSAAIDILTVTFDAYASGKRVEKNNLAELCPGYSTDLLFQSLKKLTDSQLIETTTKKRLLPALPQKNLQIRQIFSAIIGSNIPATKGGKTTEELFDQLSPILNMNFSPEEKNDSQA